MINESVTLSHWLPLVTFCPVNNMPDLLYVYVTHENVFVELYAARKKLRKAVQWKNCFMEDVAALVCEAFPEASRVEVRLMTGRHVVIREPITFPTLEQTCDTNQQKHTLTHWD